MRILHFSDVHLSKDKKAAVEMLRDRMIEKLISINSSASNKIELVIYTGDFLDKGGFDFDGNSFKNVQEGLTLFDELFITPLMDSLHLSKDRFIMTMGNHEIVRKKVPQEDIDMLQDINREQLFEDFYWRILSRYNIAWLEDYNSFENNYYLGHGNENHQYTQNKLGAFHSLNIDGQIVNIMSINTVWASCTKEEYVNINIEQINEFKRKVQYSHGAINILVGHNNYDDIVHSKTQQEIILNAITDFVHISFSGHTHQGIERGIENEHGNTYFNIASGLNRMNIGTNNANYRNGFMVVDYCLHEGWMANSWYEQDNESNFVEKVNYGEQGTSRRNLPYKKNFVPIINFLNEHPTGEYIHNDKTTELQNKLLTGAQIIRFSALPGFGKTKLIYETFIEKKNDIEYLSRIYYCKSGLKIDSVYDEFRSIINLGKASIFVIDDCPNDLLQRCSEYIRRLKLPTRLIVVNNQPYDSFYLPDCENLELSATDLKHEVDEYISQKIVVKSPGSDIINEIQTLADGFPYMAILLVNAYNENKEYGLVNIQFLVDKLLQSSREGKSYQTQAMRTLALFQPMPTENQNENAYNYVINNELITHITELNSYEIRGLFSRTLTKYSNTLIENTGDWINIRPFPLAVCLVTQWFEEMSVADLEKLFNDFQTQPKEIVSILKDGFAQRISMMQESNAAKNVISKIMSVPNGSFCSEKVVCSEMGSRLFLAMATVNPEKVAKCLRYIFKEKSTDWICENIKDDTRRNLVYALNKLCFASESYDDAVFVLAQFAEAENEHWSNNSANGLNQLFPIMLPDTEVSLEKRIKTIEELWNAGHRVLAINAINQAFKNHHFTRLGGAEKFGWHHRESYKPKTYAEIFNYWRKCKELLLSWLENDDLLLDNFCSLVENNVHNWRSTNSMNEYLFPLIDIIAPKINWHWNKMYELLMQLLRFHESEYTLKQKTKINEYINKLKPTVFADTLMYTERKIFDKYTDGKSYQEIAHELMYPLVESFINDQIYNNIDEVQALVAMQRGSRFFITELKPFLTDNVLITFLGNVWKIATPMIDDFSSNFVNDILHSCYLASPIQEYIKNLLDNGYKRAYVRALASIENDAMDSYQLLLSLYNKNEINYEHITLYMASLWGLTNSQMMKLLPSLMKQFPDKYIDILEFVMKHRYWTQVLDDELHQYVRTLLLECPLVDSQKRCNYEYVAIIKEYLKKYIKTDINFAVQMNKKIIDTLGKEFVHNNELSSLYSELLQEPYQSAILDDFIEALTDNTIFFMQVKDEVGSGFSFGSGPLFQYVPTEKLQQYCEKKVQIRHKLASMAPVFVSEANNPRADFSDFIKWLIENYGADDESGVLSGISSNMGTMSWTGSTIPLHEDMIRLLTPYVNHKYQTVQKWAQQEIDYLTQDIAREKSHDDFMRMHYS